MISAPRKLQMMWLATGSPPSCEELLKQTVILLYLGASFSLYELINQSATFPVIQNTWKEVLFPQNFPESEISVVKCGFVLQPYNCRSTNVFHIRRPANTPKFLSCKNYIFMQRSIMKYFLQVVYTILTNITKALRWLSRGYKLRAWRHLATDRFSFLYPVPLPISPVLSWYLSFRMRS